MIAGRSAGMEGGDEVLRAGADHRLNNALMEADRGELGARVELLRHHHDCRKIMEAHGKASV